jgi:hypothetical protein
VSDEYFLLKTVVFFFVAMVAADAGERSCEKRRRMVD